MHKPRFIAFIAVLLAALAATGSVFAQVTAPPPQSCNANNPCPPRSSPNLNLNSPFARLILNTIAGEIARAGETPPPDPGPQASLPENPPKPKPQRPVYRDVPSPNLRPLVSFGRPLTFAAAFEPDIVIIHIDEDFPEADLAALMAQMHLTLVHDTRFELLPGRNLKLHIDNGASVESVLRRLLGLPGILGAQPSYYFQTSQAKAAPVQDLTPLQYVPRRIDLDAAHGFGTGAGVRIGLVDTGVDIAQPVFKNASIQAFDVLEGLPVSSRDHGTAMAGLMIADAGIEGIAPRAQLLSVRTFDRDTDGTEAATSQDIARAIDWMVVEGAQVLNLSFAGPRDPLMLEMLDAVETRHVIVVAAAGNNGPDAPPAYPGAHPNSIAVTATDNRDHLFSGANLGYYISVAAPGVDVISPLPDDRFEMLTGTSIATAHVSGIVALMLEQNPDLTRDQIIADLAAQATDLGDPGPDDAFGVGLVNARDAVVAARN